MQGMPKVIGVFRVNHGGVASPECTVSLLHVVVMLLFICMGTHQGSKAPTWAAAGVVIAALVVLLIVSAVQCAVIFGSAPDSKHAYLEAYLSGTVAICMPLVAHRWNCHTMIALVPTALKKSVFYECLTISVSLGLPLYSLHTQ